MGLDRTLTVRPGSFAGNSKVYSAGPEGLANQVRQLQAVVAGLKVGALGLDWGTADSSTLVGRTIIDGSDFANDNLTLVNGDLRVPTGHLIELAGADLPDGLTANTEYFVVRNEGSNTTFKVAESLHQAAVGQFVALTGAGSGAQWIKRQIALPTELVTFDGTGGVLAVGESEFNVNADSLLDALASVNRLMNVIRVELGMPQPGIGTLTGSIATVAAVDLISIANGNDNDAILFADAQVIEQELNDAIVTVAMNVNDVAAALGLDQHLDFLSAGRGTETSNGAITDSTAASTGNVGGAATSIELTELNLKLTVWGAAVGNILQRVSVISADAQGTAPEDWTVQITPVNGTGGVDATQGLLTRQRAPGNNSSQ
jgi:hypothetical protein